MKASRAVQVGDLTAHVPQPPLIRAEEWDSFRGVADSELFALFVLTIC